MLTVTATQLPRLMACNGSRLMGGSTPPIDADTTVKDEGNAAHWLVEMHCADTGDVTEMIGQKAPNGVYITDEMVDHLQDYLQAVKGGQIEVDTSHEPSMAPRAWRVNGRADLTKYESDTQHLTIADLKYGWSIVEPEDNWALISHALGWMTKNPDKSVRSVTLGIYQPRAYHPVGRVRSITLPFTDFIELHKQIDKTLSDPSDFLNTSAHCYKCPALTTCPAARKAQMNGIDTSEQAFVDEIDNKELSFQLDHIKRAIEVLTQAQKAYNELALHRIKEGQIVDNYSLTNELTNRMWKKHITPDLMNSLTGKDLVKKQLITPAQAEKAGVSKEIVALFCERRNKGIKLVRMDADTKAKKLFNKG